MESEWRKSILVTILTVWTYPGLLKKKSNLNCIMSPTRSEGFLSSAWYLAGAQQNQIRLSSLLIVFGDHLYFLKVVQTLIYPEDRGYIGRKRDPANIFASIYFDWNMLWLQLFCWLEVIFYNHFEIWNWRKELLKKLESVHNAINPPPSILSIWKLELDGCLKM